MAQPGGESSREATGPPELNGPAGPAAYPGRGGQIWVDACGRPAHRLTARPHRQNHGEM